MLIFEEHFQDNCRNWVTRSGVDCSLGIKASHYSFDHKRSGSETYWLSWNSTEFFYELNNFHISIVLEKVTGVDSFGYGFIWGLLDSNNFFEFIISGNGLYRIAQCKNGTFEYYTNWKRCTSIQLGNGVNLLEVRRIGDNVEFYINSTVVETFSTQQVMDVLGKSFGFVIHDKINIKVHSLMITALDIEKEPTFDVDVKDSKPETKAAFIQHEAPDYDTLEKIITDLNQLVGHERTKQQLFSLANFLKVQTERKQRGLKTVDTSLHLMLYGPPGTGKTTIARLVGRLYKQLGFLERGHVIETDRAGIVGGYIGQTALRVESAVQQALDGVLFIDEAHALVPEDTPNDFGKEALQVLLKRMEDQRARLAVVVAGYPEEMEKFIESNPGLKSRVNRLFYIDHYTPNELLSIFKKFCIENGYSLDLSACIVLQRAFELAYAKRDKNFGNGRFVRTIFERSIEQQANRIVNKLEKLDNSEISLVTGDDLFFVNSDSY
ncbi:AAA ATPase central domain-containing protein [Calothrix sp. NIES-4071]|nr:AAA ATPase central domain-containing protein [Calothrix sp. NIES-4071]BAZ63129.1 AAA ATPase central domain-containing protein [Calothrix sp. NIES-4105]